MIRTTLSLAISVFIFHAGAAQAEATLKVPISILKENGDVVPMADFNRVLKTARIPELPLFFEISTKTKSASDVITDIREKIEAAAKIIAPEWADATLQQDDFPGAGNTADAVTCYAGNPSDVRDVATQMVDGFYSEQLQMFGMRFKKTIEIFDDRFDVEETKTYLEDNSQAWKNFSGQDDTMLIVSSIGDGGDDIQESTLPLCK